MQKPTERPYEMSESFARTIKTVMSLYRDTLEHEEWRKQNGSNVISMDYIQLLKAFGILPERKGKTSPISQARTVTPKGKVIAFGR